ncbi:MAG TPA: FAD-dependent oxidoreductase [Firmicutes bacterium]|nr:FAD-dependent oxidoreductase [Bacillota bacterium]
MATKLVVIGAVASGTKAAAKAKREHPDWEVTVLEKGKDISYAGCGLPYYIGNVITERKEVVVKTPPELKAWLGIDVLPEHEALKVDTAAKTVTVLDKKTGETKLFPYDKLIFATGAVPFVPPVPGIDLPQVYTVREVVDADAIRERLDKGLVHQAVVVGGGFIGLEVAENLVQRGVKTTLVELLDQVLPGFDAELAILVQRHLEEHGLTVITGDKITSFVADESGNLKAAVTPTQEIPCDLAVWATGVRPNTKLAVEAGVELGPTKAIKVNEHMETNIPDVYAVGDCAENVQLVTGKPAWMPMGSTANKMGRVAALNLNGADQKDALRGVLGTTVVKLFDMKAGKTGLSEFLARKEGFDVETVIIAAHDHAHYYPGNHLILVKLIADKATHRVLGGQVVGEGVIDKPVDVLATAITLGAKVEDLAKLDLAYAPPFSTAMPPVVTAANVLLDKLAGAFVGIKAPELKARLDAGDPDLVVVDVRKDEEVFLGKIPGAKHIVLDELDERAGEIDRSKEVVLVCKVGLRGYLAALKLKAQGFERLTVLEGGMTAWPYATE